MKFPPIQFEEEVREALSGSGFQKISLGNYKGIEENLKQIIARRILIKNRPQLSITYSYKNRDIVKNFNESEGLSLIINSISKDLFRTATLFTSTNDIILEWLPNDKWRIRKMSPTLTAPPTLSHNQTKKRHITAGYYLHLLGITDANGHVYKSGQDKYRQINHYIELLSTTLKSVSEKAELKIADMGAGKGYLTFALYDYLHHTLKIPVQIKGIEYRQDLVDICNRIAGQCGYESLQFLQGSIADYKINDENIIIALHACDTATDEAIYIGIASDAEIIVVAPCCHKQIRREMKTNNPDHDLSYVTRFGIFLERQAEMITDALRALILEYYGYKVKIVDFIADEHTPKNIMIIANKNHSSLVNKQYKLEQIKKAKSYWGIKNHHLEILTHIVKA